MADTPPDHIMDEARHWFVLMGDDDVSERDRRAFRQWLAADADHRHAWDRTQALWTRMDPVVPALRERPAQTRRLVMPWGRRSAPALVAAALVLLVLVTGGMVVDRSAILASLAADYATSPGAHRTVVLADGSTVDLAGGSALSVAFTDDRRTVELLTGEAFFTVAADAARPFVVRAGAGTARALGTAFDVRQGADGVTVAVVEHAVAVTVDGTAPVVVEAGRQLRYDPTGPSAVTASAPRQVQDWRAGRLYFEETPLREVLADLERYVSGPIIVTDEEVGAIPVSGLFETARAEEALGTIADTLPVHVLRLPGILTIVTSQ